jgi:hypothetical protein
MHEIKTIKDIPNTGTGKLLLMAIALISTTIHTDKTPDEILEIIREVKDEVFDQPNQKGMSGKNK